MYTNGTIHRSGARPGRALPDEGGGSELRSQRETSVGGGGTDRRSRDRGTELLRAAGETLPPPTSHGALRLHPAQGSRSNERKRGQYGPLYLLIW